jgi:hypothetical protein
MKAVPEFVENWLKFFSRSVRDQDFGAGKMLFDATADSFGTVCFRAENLDELVARQWCQVWPNIQNFEFEYDSARAIETPALAIVLAGWRSTALDQTRNLVERRGRATIVLKNFPAGWKALHTHFSITPQLKYDPVLRHATSSLHD